MCYHNKKILSSLLLQVNFWCCFLEVDFVVKIKPIVVWYPNKALNIFLTFVVQQQIPYTQEGVHYSWVCFSDHIIYIVQKLGFLFYLSRLLRSWVQSWYENEKQLLFRVCFYCATHPLYIGFQRLNDSLHPQAFFGCIVILFFAMTTAILLSK